ncbi:hypothetical protein ENE74_06580 [Sphingobium algorifonticola]|uniref:Uncharacterized protein n=1 Tax=Sphingobium algorifonticola TaxID=2008318 RepID=A0A437JA85_9SPHN|nr:hypothetical protein ENE74_06580 [Sphingobium algorifonticola]
MAIVAALCIGGGAITGTAIAADKPKPRPEIFTKLLDCRALTDATARLSCYDAQVAALDRAAQDDEVVLLDKAEVRKTRRSLFGFSLPRLPFLGNDDEAENSKPEFSEIQSTIKAMRDLGYGKYWFRLEDDAEWQTTEAVTSVFPKVGSPIVIKRAALGSYMGKIGRGRAVRMKRVG